MGTYSTPGSNFPFSNRPIKILGKNSDVDDTLEDLWEPGGTCVFPPAGGIQMRVNKPYALPIIFPEKVDIKISVRSDTSIANAICAAGIDTCLINANF